MTAYRMLIFCLAGILFPGMVQAKLLEPANQGTGAAIGALGADRPDYVPGAEENEQARKYGWQMSFRLKLSKAGRLANSYGNGEVRFQPTFSVNDQGALQVALEGLPEPIEVATGTAALDWHDYDVVFFPGPAASAAFYADGRLVRDGWTGHPSRENGLFWGRDRVGEAVQENARFEYHGDYVFKDQDRIPSLVVSRKTPGVVALFAERRVGGGDPGSKDNTNDVMTRVSRDFGKTWTPPLILTAPLNQDKKFDFSDPRPIYLEKEDRFLLFYARWPTAAGQNGSAIKPWMPGGVLYSAYDAASGTWAEPVEISAQVKEKSFQIVGWGGAEHYERDSGLSRRDAWTLETVLKIADGGGNAVFASNGGQEFRVVFAVDERKELTVRLNGEEKVISIQPGSHRGAAAFPVRLSYDPVRKIARLKLDGKTIAAWKGVPSTERKVGFGQVDASVDGRLHVMTLRLKKNGREVVDFDAGALTVLDPADHEREPEKLGWTKISVGAANSFYGVASINPGPGHGIELQRQTMRQGGRNGRLLYPAIILDQKILNVASVYSDDRGKTWSVGASLPVPGRMTAAGLETLQPTEADLAERLDGCILLTARLDFNRVVEGVDYGPRHQFVSCNGGLTWDMPKGDDSRKFAGISGGSVDASITRFTENNGDAYLLFVNPMGAVPGGPERENLGLWFSFDEGESWKGPIQIVNDGSAYSDIFQLDDARAMVIVEDARAGMRTMRLPIALMKQKALGKTSQK